MVPPDVRPTPSLPPTGERTGPGLPDEDYWFGRHEAAYAWIAERWSPRIAGAVVADAGTGEGYGTTWLGSGGPRVLIGWEYDDTACAHIRRAYPAVVITRANLDALPAQDASMGLIACCQVIEHLWDLPRFLRECRRLLRPGGELIVTTPNRDTFSPGLGRGHKPVNPFHVEEFDAEQVDDMLRSAGFTDVDVMGLHHGERLVEWERRHGSLVAAQVDAVLSDHWGRDLRDFVASVTRRDFTVAESTESAADLIGIGRAT